MQRFRTISAAPARSASEAVTAVADLVSDALGPAAGVDSDDVRAGLDHARPALLALVAGGHLEDNGVVLVADALHLTINVVGGDKALSNEENLAVVPGGATATEWTVYLPTPEPIGSLVNSAADGHPNLSTSEPPADSQPKSSASLVDLGALASEGK